MRCDIETMALTVDALWMYCAMHRTGTTGQVTQQYSRNINKAPFVLLNIPLRLVQSGKSD